MKLLLLTALFITSIACNDSGKDAATKDDTTNKKAADTNSYSEPNNENVAKPTDTTNIVTLKVDLTCEQAQARINNGVGDDLVSYNMALAMLAKCGTIEYNQKHPDSTRVTVMGEETDKDGNTTIAFGVMTYKTGEAIANVVKTMIALGVFKETGDPLTTLVSTAAGDYMVDSYLNAAVKNDPLLIVLPTAIPGKQLTTDIYRQVTKTVVAKKVEVAVTKVGEHIKNHPEDVIAPTITVPIKVGEKVVKGAGNSVKKGLKKIGL